MRVSHRLGLFNTTHIPDASMNRRRGVAPADSPDPDFTSILRAASGIETLGLTLVAPDLYSVDGLSVLADRPVEAWRSGFSSASGGPWDLSRVLSPNSNGNGRLLLRIVPSSNPADANDAGGATRHRWNCPLPLQLLLLSLLLSICVSSVMYLFQSASVEALRCYVVALATESITWLSRTGTGAATRLSAAYSALTAAGAGAAAAAADI